jgi:hypothetical protein
VNLWDKKNEENLESKSTKTSRMLQLKYHSYISEGIIFFYIPRNVDMVDWSRSPQHKWVIDGNENYRLPLVCLMENGHNILTP